MKKVLLFLMLCLSSTLMLAQTHYQPVSFGTSGSMVLIGKIQINGVDQTSDQLELGVFCGDECRGACIIQPTPPFVSPSYYFVNPMVYGDAGNTFTFTLYDHSLGEELDLTPPESIVFDESGYGNLFNPIDPYILNFTSSTTTYTITASASPTVGGTVTGGGTFIEGETCTLTATPNTGYHFVGWILNQQTVSTQNPYSFTVNGDATYTAIFALNSYTITATANPTAGGTVTYGYTPGGGTSGGNTYYHGDECTLIATANTGYTFTNWTKNGTVVSTSATYTFTVTETAAYVANFSPNSYTITATANPTAGGSITGAGAHDYGTTCTLTATANTGYTFVNWTQGDGSVVSTNATYTFTVTGAAAYVANFSPNSYDITAWANPEDGGYVTIEPEVNNFYHGDTCTLYAWPNTDWGYHFVNWTKNGTVVSTDDIYEFIVTEDGEYIANFALDTFNVTVIVDPVEAGSVTGGGTYEFGDQVTLTATANTGYTFSYWSGGERFDGGDDPTTSFYIYNDTTIVAHFNINSYTIAASANPANSGSVTGAGTYNYNTSCTLVAIPSPGYHFVYWTKGDDIVGENDTLTFTVTAPATYIANFEEDVYTISATTNPEGAGVITGTGNNFHYQDECTLSVTANPGRTFSNWTKNGVVVSEEAEYTFTVTESAAFVANFDAVPYTIYAYNIPEEGGNVTGAGTHNFGTTCTLTATAATGYHFVNWEVNEEAVSTQNPISFTVTNDSTFFALYELNTYAITATVEPEAGGSVTGANTYTHGDTCTLVATTNTGYTFLNWTKNGNVVSTDASYSFIVTEAGAYVANFQINSYDITASANPIAGGSITGAGNYNYGTTCTLVATANTGYTFVNWTKGADVVSTEASFSFTVTQDSAFVAHFSLNSYDITASANPEAGGTITGANTYYHGTSCTLTATANEGYTFVNWTKGDDIVSTNATYTFTVTAAGAYVANFQINTYEVSATVNPTAAGTITGTGTYNHGSTCTLTVTPNYGYTFVNWTKNGEAVGTSTTLSFTVTEAAAYVANFSINTYDITATANPEAGGSVTGAGNYTYNTSCTLTATANEGYTFVNWTKNGTAVSTSASYTFTVTEEAAYVANFSLNSYEITATVNPTAAGTITGAGTYNHGTTCTLTVTPNAGYTFINWTKNGEAVGTSATLSFTVTEAAAYVANFSLNSYTIAASANPANGGSVTGAGTYNYGTSCTLTATAATGYTFVNWTKDGESVGTSTTLSFTVTEAATYVANFSLNSYAIAASANPASYGTVTGAGTYNHGESCTLTATPASDSYLFVNWTKNGTVVSTNPSYTFTVTGAGSYVANFIPNQYEITASATPANGGSVAGAGTYNYNTTCTLTATAATGYTFVNWTKNGTVVSTSASYSFTVTENASYVAHFSLNSYTIAASANPTNGGNVTGAGTYNHGENCTLTATPGNNSYVFVNWTKNGTVVSTSASYSFTVTESASYVAHFNLITHEISATANPTIGGTITGAGTYAHGTSCTLAATPNTGYTFISWTKNGNVVSQNATYSFTVTEDAAYVANFGLSMCTITLAADPQDGGTVSGAGTYNYGDNCTVNANPNAGYTFVNWTKNGTVVSNNASYTFTLTENVSLVAHFSQEHYTITVAANPAEGGTVTGGGSFTYGQTCNLTATANTGYTFVNWTRNGVNVSSNASYSFSVTDNGNYVANFAVTQYTITVTADPAEGGNVHGGGTFPYGTLRTLHATANEHYSFVNWTKNGNVISTNPNHPVIVTENAEYVAHFRKDVFEITAMVDPEGTGDIEGTGFYNYGDICTLTVTPDHGYMLVNWTLDGVVASTNETFSFVVTEDRFYVAHMDTDGIEEQGTITMSLFPNPAKNKLTVEASEPVKMLEIYNINGALVYRQSDCEATTIVNVDSYAPGTYMIRLTTDNAVGIRRFVKE